MTPENPVVTALDPVLTAAGLVDPHPAGSGRRGATWRARRPDRPEPVALKVVPLSGDRARRRFLAEVAVLRALPPDPHLMPILDAGVASGDRAWLITPWMEGGSLESAGPLPADAVAAAARDAGRGLAILHRHAVVHANLTPANLLRDAHGEVRLDGMGLPGLEPPDSPGGRPGYVPPEVLEGGPWSAAGDLWSLGACLYFLLYGRPPWLEAEPAAHLLAMAGGLPRRPDPPGVPAWLSGLVRACLALEPAERPAGAEAVALWAGGPEPGRADTLAPGPGQSEGRPLGSSYLLVEPLGAGSSGQVWRGRRRWDGTQVAVKVLRPELSGDPEAVARFLRERTTLVGLEHPNLVKILDLVAEGGTLAIVMELVDGVDLRRLLREEGPVSSEQAARLLAQVAAGLAEVHRAGVVHRDLKPENVLVERPPGAPMRARLTDFGIARTTGDTVLTSANQLLGTAEYLAPELVSGRPLTPAADVYSLGVVGYELFAGRRPFSGEHPAAVLRAHLDTAPAPLTDLPAPLWDLLARCLAKDPAGRPEASGVAALLEGLAPTLGGRPAPPPAPPPIAAPASDPPSRTAAFVSPLRPPAEPAADRAEPARRLPRWALVAGLAALVAVGLVAGLVVALTGGHSRPPTELTADITTSVAVTGPGTVKVTWADVSGRPGFYTYLLLQDGRPSSTQPSAGNTSVAVNGIPAGAHCFRVAAAFTGRIPSGLPRPNLTAECVSVP